jgi:hypothetical protein
VSESDQRPIMAQTTFRVHVLWRQRVLDALQRAAAERGVELEIEQRAFLLRWLLWETKGDLTVHGPSKAVYDFVKDVDDWLLQIPSDAGRPPGSFYGGGP